MVKSNNSEILVEADARKFASGLAMTIVLISFSMLFATMFMGYVMYRSTSVMWPPMGMEKIDVLLPSISTGAILLSSVCYYFFEKNNKFSYLLGTLGLGVLFMISQLRLWGFLKEEGYYLSTGIYASIIYGFTWTHALHIVLGLALLVALVFKFKNPSDEVKLSISINNTGKFWHFLGVIWILMYLTLFVF